MRRMRRWRERDEGHREMGRWHEFLHWLHEPADWGRKEYYEVKHPAAHRIHLIPGALLGWFCARTERKK